MSKVTVLHASYGCETGCCGHVIEVDGEQVGRFQFSHPYGEDKIEFAKKLITEVLGPEHVADLDWENCMVFDD
jgi:hypothetical protein